MAAQYPYCQRTPMYSNATLKTQVLFLLLLVMSFGGGCASLTTKPFPRPQDRLGLLPTNDVPKETVDLPIGVYRIPDSNLYIANQQGDHALVGASALFGLVGAGVAAADTEGKNKSEVAGFEEQLGSDVPKIAEDLLKKRMVGKRAEERFFLSDDPANSPIQITTYAVLSFIEDKRWRLWTVLKVDYFPSGYGNREWYCRYISGTERPRPMDGPEGWSANNGKNLRSSLEKNLSNSIDVMLKDLSGGLRPEKPQQIRSRGRWMFYKKPQENTVTVIEAGTDRSVVLPQVEEDEYFAGINILPKDFEEKRPEKKKGRANEVTFQQGPDPQTPDRNEKP